MNMRRTQESIHQQHYLESVSVSVKVKGQEKKETEKSIIA